MGNPQYIHMHAMEYYTASKGNSDTDYKMDEYGDLKENGPQRDWHY